jgi:hypothetical protein
MDRGVRLAKAYLLVAEYEAFSSRISWRDIAFSPMMTFVRNMQVSILTRLRRLSLDFVPLGLLGDSSSFPTILGRIKTRCLAGDAFYRAVRADPRMPRAMKYMYYNGEVAAILARPLR